MNRTGTHRTNCINETDSHSCMYNTQYWRCTFTGVVLVSNCNRSRCIFSSYGCLQFQRNFATSKRIYICTNRMVCVCVERTVMCCDVWCELRCRVVMKNENKWEYWAEDAKMKLNSTVCPSFSLVAPFFLTVCFPSYSFLSCFSLFSFNVPVYIASINWKFFEPREHSHTLTERNNDVFL